MKSLLGKKGIKTKSASEGGKRKVDYFRGKDFQKWAKSTEGVLVLCKKCVKLLGSCLNSKVPQTDEDVNRLGAELLLKGFCYKAVHNPMNKTKDDKPKKWPDRLSRDPRGNSMQFDPELYYVIEYQGDRGWQHFLLACIIAGVLLVCMWPVWPLWAKIGIWYLSVIFLTLYFGILIGRLIVYTLFWVVGFDFWIFPNINDDYCGIVDSFKPLYSWEKRKDDPLMLFVRFGSLGILAVAIEQISQTCSIQDVGELVVSSYADVIDWGMDKIMALPGSEKMALPSLQDIEGWSAGDNDTNETLSASDVAPEKEEKSGDNVEM